jgi:hypothetical protein
MARHLPWYIDSKNPDDENRYYLEHSKLGGLFYTSKSKDILDLEKENQ